MLTLQTLNKAWSSNTAGDDLYDDLVIIGDSNKADLNYKNYLEDKDEDNEYLWSQQMASFENYYDFWVKNSDWMELIMKNALLQNKRSRSYTFIDRAKLFKENIHENADKAENNSADAEGDRNLKDSTKINSNREVNQEEAKFKNVSVGLSHDMLMKLDQENMSKYNIGDHSNWTISSSIHPAPPVVSSSSSNLKPRNNKAVKQPKLMPSK